MYARKFYGTLYGLTLLVVAAHTANILAVHPIKVRSHFRFHEAIVDALVAAGHRVTLVSPFAPRNPSPNITHVDTRLSTDENVNPFSLYDFKSMSWEEVLLVGLSQYEKDCYDIMKLEQVNDILNSSETKYDAMFLEMFHMHECYYPIAHKLGIPVIGTWSSRSWPTIDNEFGNSRNPAVVPFDWDFNPKTMTFLQRLKNVYNSLLFDLYFYGVLESAKVRKFHETHFPAYDLRTHHRGVSLAFVNGHPSVFSRPLVPGIVEIGGINTKRRTEPLPQNIKKFIEEAERGVILFTFGTITTNETINPQIREAFRDTFAKIPQRVIWKFEENIENLSDNVLLLPWVPQPDILGHKNVIAFISHCGIHGTYEAIYNGKPMISIPIFTDQMSNAALLNELGVGIYLNILTLTVDKLTNALDRVVNDTSYRENMRTLSVKFRDTPMSPQETVVFWTEYVIRHKGAHHLKTVAAVMPWYQYLLLDVILFVIVILFISLYSVYYLLKKVYHLLIGPLKNTNRQKSSVTPKIKRS